jgi:hypothetical protein
VPISKAAISRDGLRLRFHAQTNEKVQDYSSPGHFLKDLIQLRALVRILASRYFLEFLVTISFLCVKAMEFEEILTKYEESGHQWPQEPGRDGKNAFVRFFATGP